MEARADDTFDPAGIVTRRDMAVHLAAFLSEALVGPGGVDIDDLKNSDESGDTPFTDISEVSVSAHKAIRDIFELGVTEGKTDTTFVPNDPVSRAQMAAFITRALAHTNARPAGIAAQGPANADTDDSVDISVSVRDDSHGPVPDALVGAITSTTPDEAFDDEGACVDDKSDGACSIATSNEATDPDGNAELTVGTPEDAGTLTVWVWTGDSGDDFDADTTDSAMLEIDAALPPTQTQVNDDTKEHADFLKFGDTVTYTFQVANKDGDAVAKADAEVTVKATIEDVTDDPAGSADNGELRDDVETTVTTHKTDAAGSFEVSFTADDPNSGDDNRGDRVRLLLTLSGASYGLSSKANDQGTDSPTTGTETIQIDWSDAASAATTLSLSSADYHEVDSDGGGVSNTLRATLVNQYGDSIRGQKVSVWSTDGGNDADNDPLSGLAGTEDAPADHRTTNRSGVATKRYTRTGTAAATELLDANYIKVNGNCRDILTDCLETSGADGADDAAVNAEAVTHYWAVRVSTGTTLNNASDVLVADTDNNSIVLTTGTSLVTYTSGDYFQISGNSATMEAFEKELSAADGDVGADTVSVTFNDDSDINTFNIATPGTT